MAAPPPPPPWKPQKLCVKIVEKPVTCEGSCAVASIVSVPSPKLLRWTKLRTVNDWAAPTVGINWPFSCIKIPSEKSGSNDKLKVHWSTALWTH